VLWLTVAGMTNFDHLNLIVRRTIRYLRLCKDIRDSLRGKRRNDNFKSAKDMGQVDHITVRLSSPES